MRSNSELGVTWDRLGAFLGPPWAALGLSWASLGHVLEPLGALSGALEALSGALGAVRGPSCGSLRRLKTQIDEMSKTLKSLRKINVFGGRRVQDAAKLGQVRRKKGPSWHLEAILEPRRPKMAEDGEDGFEDAG